jgi:hypothetical protein
MRRLLFVMLGFALFVPLLAGGQAAGTQRSVLANRMGPSGTYSVDPTQFPAYPTHAARKAPAVAPSIGSGGCPSTAGGNVRVNQECTNQDAPGYFGRAAAQNETAVAVNPNDPQNVVISQNDYRRGDGNCGVDFSLDGGKHWGSTTAPVSFTPGFTAPRHYWDAGGDTSVGFDTSGEAYLMCQVFDRGLSVADESDNASAFIIFRSADGGASWSFPGNYVTKSDGTGSDGIGLLDKEYMAIDSNPSSPYADRIYVAWAQYSTSFTASPIHFAYSTDYGVTWHQTGSISGHSASLCPINFSGAPAGTCDASQFADPFVGPDGSVYVAFVNANNCAGALRQFGFDCPGNKNDNHNQILIVKSTDGGNSFRHPVKATDYYDLPDCLTYTGEDPFRACVPTAPLSGTSIFRATNYPSGAVLGNGNVMVTFGSYINQHSNRDKGNCSPAGISPTTGLNLYNGVGEVNGCNDDILSSVSANGGASFTGTSAPVDTLPVVSDERPGGPLADQFWQWMAVSPSGRPVVSYYDRKYGGDQSSGYLDFTLASGNDHTRVTNASMPPGNEFPGTNGYTTFLGDYTGLAIGSDGVAHPAWADTRNPLFTYDESTDARHLVFAGYDEDVYTRAIRLQDIAGG